MNIIKIGSRRRFKRSGSAISAICLGLAGCATPHLDQIGSLSTYDNLEKSDGLLTHGSVFINAERLAGAKTLKITPAHFAEIPATAALTPDQKKLISNSINRTICMRVGSAYRVVRPEEEAELNLHVTISSATPTNALASGASKVAGVLPKILLPSVPVPVPRLPIGLGSLSAEAEVTDPKGVQVAAMVWARGADSFTTSGRVSSDGDAYDLAQTFSDDLTKLIVNRTDPIRPNSTYSLPDVGAMMRQIGVKPNDANCALYGRSPGLIGQVGSAVGAPPNWTDKGSEAPAPAATKANVPE
eukprot:gene6572-6641_t